MTPGIVRSLPKECYVALPFTDARTTGEISRRANWNAGKIINFLLHLRSIKHFLDEVFVIFWE